MRIFKANSIIVTSMGELCRWLQKDDISIIEIIPTKGIDKEDVVKIMYVPRKEEES